MRAQTYCKVNEVKKEMLFRNYRCCCYDCIGKDDVIDQMLQKMSSLVTRKTWQILQQILLLQDNLYHDALWYNQRHQGVYVIISQTTGTLNCTTFDLRVDS